MKTYCHRSRYIMSEASVNISEAIRERLFRVASFYFSCLVFKNVFMCDYQKLSRHFLSYACIFIINSLTSWNVIWNGRPPAFGLCHDSLWCVTVAPSLAGPGRSDSPALYSRLLSRRIMLHIDVSCKNIKVIIIGIGTPTEIV